MSAFSADGEAASLAKEKAKHAISREVWCLKREKSLTPYGDGFVAGLVLDEADARNLRNILNDKKWLP